MLKSIEGNFDNQEVHELLNNDPRDDFVRFWRKFETSQLPAGWLVWPHSKSKGWMSRIEGTIPIL